MRISISSTQRRQLLQWAKEAEPSECCGLLLGENHVVEHVQLTINVARDPLHAFEIDPRALIAAEKRARNGGMDIVGYFHSHLNGEAQPSLTDARMAAADGRCWLIIARGSITAWRPLQPIAGGPVAFVSEGVEQG